MKTQDYLREFSTMFFMRQRMIGAIALGAVVVGLLIVLLWPPVYQAQGAIILKGSQVLAPEDSLSDARAEIDQYGETDLFSEMEILNSQSVAVAAAQQLASDERFSIDATEPTHLEAFGSRITDNLSTSLVPRSDVIEANLNWNDPERAQAVLDAVFEEYLQRRQAVFNPKEAESFFQTQVQVIRAGLDDLEDRMLAITGGAGVDQLTDEIKRNVELESSLRSQLNDLKGQRVEQANYVDYLDANLDEQNTNLFTSIDNLELGDFAKKIQDLIIRKEELLKDYETRSPPVERIQEQLDRVYAIFRDEAERYIARERSSLETITEQIDGVQSRLDSVAAENKKLYQDLLQARRLDRERRVSEDSYQTFAQRLRESRIRNETKSDRLFRVGIVAQPHASASAVFPRTGQVLPTSMLLGLLLGVTVGFLAEFFDHSFKRPEDIETYTQLPYLFSVPDYSRGRG